MTEPIKSKALIERFSRFVEHGRHSPQDTAAFKRRLDKIAAHSEERGDSGESGDSERKRPLQGARRHQPPAAAGAQESVAPEKAVKQLRLPHHGRHPEKKNISLRHAERLSKLAPVIEDAARRHNVPVELICGVIIQESGCQPRAVSHAGARGLMQLMPATARRFGVKDSFDPAQNIEGGTRYLRWLLDRFDGDVELALAGYNAGEGNVEKYGRKIPPFKETQAYVPAVLAYTRSMIEIFSTLIADKMPTYARRV